MLPKLPQGASIMNCSYMDTSKIRCEITCEGETDKKRKIYCRNGDGNWFGNQSCLTNANKKKRPLQRLTECRHKEGSHLFMLWKV